MQPINYSLNVPDPVQNMSNAIGLGVNLTQLKAAQAQIKQAEASAEQQKVLHADLAKVSANPNPSAVAQLIIKYPQFSEQFKRGYDALGSEQQKAKLNNASQVYAALLAGDDNTAVDTLGGYAEAYRNSGMVEDAKATESLMELVKMHPETAKTTAGIYLASAMGPEKFAENFTKLESERRERGLEPDKLTVSQATAREAATKAKFAESNAVMDIQKKGWDIYKIQEDAQVAKENSRIAALTAGLTRETNDLRKQELQAKLEDAKLVRDQAVRDRVVAAETSRSTIDNSLSTIDRVLINPSLNDVLGSLEGGVAGSVKNIFSDEAQNAIADIETIKSQTFINQLKTLKDTSPTGSSGLGALSEKEGDRLISAVQSLSRKQGEAQFEENLREVQRLLLKSRKSISTKSGMPDTIPDTPNVESSPEELESYVTQYGGD